MKRDYSSACEMAQILPLRISTRKIASAPTFLSISTCFHIYKISKNNKLKLIFNVLNGFRPNFLPNAPG